MKRYRLVEAKSLTQPHTITNQLKSGLSEGWLSDAYQTIGRKEIAVDWEKVSRLLGPIDPAIKEAFEKSFDGKAFRVSEYFRLISMSELFGAMTLPAISAVLFSIAMKITGSSSASDGAFVGGLIGIFAALIGLAMGMVALLSYTVTRNFAKGSATKVAFKLTKQNKTISSEDVKKAEKKLRDIWEIASFSEIGVTAQEPSNNKPLIISFITIMTTCLLSFGGLYAASKVFG